MLLEGAFQAKRQLQRERELEGVNQHFSLDTIALFIVTLIYVNRNFTLDATLIYLCEIWSFTSVLHCYRACAIVSLGAVWLLEQFNRVELV